MGIHFRFSSIFLVLVILSISDVSALRRKWKNHHQSKSSPRSLRWRSALPSNETEKRSDDVQPKPEDSKQNDEEVKDDKQQTEEPVAKRYHLDHQILNDFVDDLKDIKDDLNEIESRGIQNDEEKDDDSETSKEDSKRNSKKSYKSKSAMKRGDDDENTEDDQNVKELKRTIDDVVKQVRAAKKGVKSGDILQKLSDCLALIMKAVNKLPKTFVDTIVKLKNAVMDLINGIFGGGGRKKKTRKLVEGDDDYYY